LFKREKLRLNGCENSGSEPIVRRQAVLGVVKKLIHTSNPCKRVFSKHVARLGKCTRVGLLMLRGREAQTDEADVLLLMRN